jgi:hypothetical protein
MVCSPNQHLPESLHPQRCFFVGWMGQQKGWDKLDCISQKWWDRNSMLCISTHSKVIHCRVSHVICRSESQVVHSLDGSATHDPKMNKRDFLEMSLYHIFFGVLSFYTIPYKIQLPYIKNVLNSLKFQKTCDGFDIETAIVQSTCCGLLRPL